MEESATTSQDQFKLSSDFDHEISLNTNTEECMEDIDINND